MAVMRIKTERHWYGYRGFDIERHFSMGKDGKWVMSEANNAKFENDVRAAKREGRDLPTPKQIKALRMNKLGVSQRRMAELVGGGRRSIQKYEAGTALPGTAMANLLRLLNHDPKLVNVLKIKSWQS